LTGRITGKQLEALATWLNEITKSPTETWTRDKSGKLSSNIGNYSIGGSYGGVALERIVNKFGAVENVFGGGVSTKRELFNLMHAYKRGLLHEKEMENDNK